MNNFAPGARQGGHQPPGCEHLLFVTGVHDVYFCSKCKLRLVCVAGRWLPELPGARTYGEIFLPPLPPNIEPGQILYYPASVGTPRLMPSDRPAPTSVPSGGSPRSDSGVDLFKWREQQRALFWKPHCGNPDCDGVCGDVECKPPAGWESPAHKRLAAMPRTRPTLPAELLRSHPLVFLLAWLVLRYRGFTLFWRGRP